MIVAADVPPSQLDSIDQRMRSRLMGGLVVDIEMPDLETRRRILQSRYETMQRRDPSVLIPDEVLEFIANRVTGTRPRARRGAEPHHRLPAVQPCRGDA